MIFMNVVLYLFQGILATPDYSRTGELQTLNMKLRNELDLFANVVHVRSLPGVKSRHKVGTTITILNIQNIFSLYRIGYYNFRTSIVSSFVSKPRVNTRHWSTSVWMVLSNV